MGVSQKRRRTQGGSNDAPSKQGADGWQKGSRINEGSKGGLKAGGGGGNKDSRLHLLRVAQKGAPIMRQQYKSPDQKEDADKKGGGGSREQFHREKNECRNPIRQGGSKSCQNSPSRVNKRTKKKQREKRKSRGGRRTFRWGRKNSGT